MTRFRLLALIACLATGGLMVAAAAQLNVTSEDLGAGVSTVVSCDTDGVEVEYGVEWGTSTAIELPGEFAVTSITVTDIAPGCAGQYVLAGLIDDGGAEIGFVIPAEITGDTATAFAVRPVAPNTCLTSFDPSSFCNGVSAEELGKIGVLITPFSI